MQEYPALQAVAATCQGFFAERRDTSEFPVQTIRADGVKPIEREHGYLQCKPLAAKDLGDWAGRL
jgi:hypothetical protein